MVKLNDPFFLPPKGVKSDISHNSFSEKTLRCSEKNTTMFRRKHCDVFYNKYRKKQQKTGIVSTVSTSTTYIIPIFYFCSKGHLPVSVFRYKPLDSLDSKPRARHFLSIASMRRSVTPTCVALSTISLR